MTGQLSGWSRSVGLSLWTARLGRRWYIDPPLTSYGGVCNNRQFTRSIYKA